MRNSELIGCDLAWKRDGADWVLLHKRRRIGRVAPDHERGGMYRVVLSRGRLSDMANLSRAKDAALATAIRELEYEARDNRRHRAIDPPKCPERGGCFTASAPPVAPTAPDGHPVHQNEEAATSIGCGAPLTSERRS